jgi:5-formyltetrahydrofolate cyclo-ligase
MTADHHPIDRAKRALRTELRQLLQSLNVEDISARSLKAAARLCRTEAFEHATSLMLFLPLPGEVDARPIARRAWELGKHVAVPLVSYEQGRMMPIELTGLDGPMQADRYGVLTPHEGLPVPIDALDLVVVPGLAFDHHGRRLGRGGGFYDRFLAQPGFHATVCGLGFEEQLLDHVPARGHDIALDMLVTDRRTLSFTHTDPA